MKGQRDSIFANAVSAAVKDFAKEIGEKPGCKVVHILSLQEQKMQEGVITFNAERKKIL